MTACRSEKNERLVIDNKCLLLQLAHLLFNWTLIFIGKLSRQANVQFIYLLRTTKMIECEYDNYVGRHVIDV